MACSKCGKSGSGVASRLAAANASEYALIRYVGLRVGSVAYQVGSRTYLFGQNRVHASQLVYRDDVFFLLSNAPLSFVELPMGMSGQSPALHTRIQASTKIVSDKSKKIFADQGIETLGQILTLDVNVLAGLGISKPAELQSDIRIRFGMEQAPEVDAPAIEMIIIPDEQSETLN